MKINFRTHGLTGSLRFGAPDIEGWMSCNVFAQVPGITAEYRCFIERAEVQHFRNELAAAIEGRREVDFEAMELGVRLKLTIDDRGGITWRLSISQRFGWSLPERFV